MNLYLSTNFKKHTTGALAEPSRLAADWLSKPSCQNASFLWLTTRGGYSVVSELCTVRSVDLASISVCLFVLFCFVFVFVFFLVAQQPLNKPKKRKDNHQYEHNYYSSNKGEGTTNPAALTTNTTTVTAANTTSKQQQTIKRICCYSTAQKLNF